jgi:hypothetical protein
MHTWCVKLKMDLMCFYSAISFMKWLAQWLLGFKERDFSFISERFCNCRSQHTNSGSRADQRITLEDNVAGIHYLHTWDLKAGIVQWDFWIVAWRHDRSTIPQHGALQGIGLIKPVPNASCNQKKKKCIAMYSGAVEDKTAYISFALEQTPCCVNPRC